MTSPPTMTSPPAMTSPPTTPQQPLRSLPEPTPGQADYPRVASGVSVIIPAKNEAANIPWVLARIPDWVDEVLIVDGLSTDDTIEVARRCRPDIVVVHESRRGKGAAIRAGLQAARGDVLVMIDADGSMDPREIGLFVQRVREGAELAKGSRRMPGGGSADITVVRDLGNRALLAGANLLYQQRLSELCYGYMAIAARRLPDLELVSDGFEIEAEIVARALRCGLAVVEVPSFEAPRRAGASNLNAVRDGLRIVRTLLGVRLGWRRSAVESRLSQPARDA